MSMWIRRSAAIALLAIGTVAHATDSMKATAPDKMTPRGDAAKMRACDKLAIERKIKMEDRAAFVERCMAKR